MNQKTVLIGILLTGLVFLVGVLTPTPALKAESSPLKIGMLVDQTGFFSWYGEKSLMGARIRVQEVNENGGINGRPLKLVVYNTESKPERAIQGARKMIEDENVVALAGLGFVGPIKAVAPLIKRRGGPLTYTTCGAYVPTNRYTFAGTVYVREMVERVLRSFKKRGWERVALLSTNNATGQNALQNTRTISDKLDLNLVSTELFNPGQVDLTSQLTSIRSKNPDVLFAWVIGKPMGIVIKNYRQLELELPMVTSHGNIAPQFLQSLKKYQPEEFYIPATRDIIWEDLPENDPSKPMNRRFHNAFDKRFEVWPGLGGGTGYDALYMISKALRAKGPDTMEMIKYIEGLQNVPGVVGTYNFSREDHRGLGLDDAFLTRVRNGKLHLINP